MKKKGLVFFFLGISVYLLLVSCKPMKSGIQEQTSQTKTPENALLFLGNKNIAPVVFLDGNTPSGVAIDIVNALAQHIQQPIKIQVMDWAEAQALVAQGEADALIQINPSEERKKIYDFSDTLLESQFSIFTRSDKMGISGLSSLRGLRVGVESGGLPQQQLERDPQILLTIIPNFLEGFKMLDDSTIDAVVVDYRVGSYILAENHIRNIKVTGEPIAFSYSSIAVKKGNIKLLNAINNSLHIIKTDGTYQKIIDKWKPTEVVFQTQEQITERILFGTILSVLFLLLIAVIWIVTIKKELTKRKITEAKEREEYSILSSIINNNNALIFSVDQQYHYTSFNKGHAAVMKAIYGEEIEIGYSILEYMTVAEDRETARHNIDRALAGEQLVEEAYSGEEKLTRRYFQVSHSPIKAETGEVIGVAVLSQDMTERKHAEETHRESERRYRDIFDNVVDGLYLLDVTKDGHFRTIDVNPALEQMTGIPHSQSVGKTQEEIVPEEVARQVNAKYQRCIEASHVIEEEVELELPSGRHVFQSILIPTSDATGSINRIIGISRDITERKQMEGILRESEHRYREIFENSADVLYLLEVTEDGHFRNLEENRAFEKSTGLSREQLKGKIIEETVTDETTRIVNALYHRCVDTGDIIDEDVVFVLPIGKRVYHSTLVPLRDDSGRIYRILGISRDITEKKQAEEEIQKTYALLTETQSIAQLGGWEVDVETGQVKWTEETYRIHGVGHDYDPNDIEYTMKFFPPKDRQIIDQAFQSAIEFRIPYDIELEFIRADGQHLWIRTMAKPVVEGSKVVRIKGNIMDITENKHASEALRLSKQKYYEEKQKRSHELEILTQISSALRQAVDQPEISISLLNETVTALQADAGVVYLFSRGDKPPFVFQKGSGADDLISLFTSGDNYWDQAQKEPIYYFTPPYYDNENELMERSRNVSVEKPKSVVSVQLRTANDVMGLLVLGYFSMHEPSVSEQGLLVSIAEIGGNALHRSGIMTILEQRVAERTLELKTLYEVSVITHQPLNLIKILRNTLFKVRNVMTAQVVAIYQIDEEQTNLNLVTKIISPNISLVQTVPLTIELQGLFGNENEPLIINTRDSLRIPFVSPGSEYHSCVNIPIFVDGKTYGIMCIIWEHLQELSIENVVLLSSMAKHIASAIQNDALNKRVGEVAVLKERHRLASELHDSVTQLLYGQTLLTNAGQEYLKINDHQRLGQCLEDIGSTAAQSLKEMRLLLYELNSSPIKQEGLEISLRHRVENVEKRLDIKIEFTSKGTIALSTNDQRELFLIACEALNNSLKHSKASRVSILLDGSEDSTLLEISDNGIGFDTTNLSETGMGLLNMKDRAKRIRGRLKIKSEKNIGTCVHIRIS